MTAVSLYRPLNGQTKMFTRSLVTPAQAGVQETCEKAWIPAPDQVEGRLCAGMTTVRARFDEPFKSR